MSLIEFSLQKKKAFIDIDKIINESEFGKNLTKRLRMILKKENENY